MWCKETVARESQCIRSVVQTMEKCLDHDVLLLPTYSNPAVTSVSIEVFVLKVHALPCFIFAGRYTAFF